MTDWEGEDATINGDADTTFTCGTGMLLVGFVLRQEVDRVIGAPPPADPKRPHQEVSPHLKAALALLIDSAAPTDDPFGN